MPLRRILQFFPTFSFCFSWEIFIKYIYSLILDSPFSFFCIFFLIIINFLIFFRYIFQLLMVILVIWKYTKKIFSALVENYQVQLSRVV